MAENSKSSRILKAFCMETTLHGWAYLTYDEKVSPKCAKYETNYLPKYIFKIQPCSFSRENIKSLLFLQQVHQIYVGCYSGWINCISMCFGWNAI